MAIMNRLSKLLSFNSRQIHGPIKKDANGNFYLDNDSLLRTLEAQGISKYANTTTSILKEAMEEISNDFKSKTRPLFFLENSLVAATFDYLMGAACVFGAIDLWRRHSRFFGNA